MTASRDDGVEPFTTLIVGAGFSGLGAAARLLEAGITDIVILERAGGVGGTWRDNTYPGVACDIPSLLYSYSFEQNPRWTQTYASGAEIQHYIEDVVRKRDLRRFIRFHEDVSSLTWDEHERMWRVETAHSVYRARTVIVAYGPLANSSLPDIDGIDSFAGHLVHTARWDHDLDFAGKAVAVIGTGSTAVQVIPTLVEQAKSVRVFQRTPGWVFPRATSPTSSAITKLFTAFPPSQRVCRSVVERVSDVAALAVVWNNLFTSSIELAGRAYLAREVEDRWLRRRLTPRYRPGCKRMLVSSSYLRAIQAPNCELVTWPIARISEHGIMTCEGVERRVDVIVCATGYDVTKTAPPVRIVGQGGRSLNDEWQRGAFAYKSVNVAGYPNLFFTFGPNSGPGHTSALAYMEAEIDYAVRLIQLMVDRRLTSMTVRADAQSAHNEWVQRRLAKTTWNSGGCTSWYLTEDGVNTTMFPGRLATFRKLLRDIDLQDYVATGAVDEFSAAGVPS